LTEEVPGLCSGNDGAGERGKGPDSKISSFNYKKSRTRQAVHLLGQIRGEG